MTVKAGRAPLCLLIAVVLALGLYASWLNHQFYLSQGPFFDSAAYTNYLARVIGATQLDGLKDGLYVALDATTSPLPGLEAILTRAASCPYFFHAAIGCLASGDLAAGFSCISVSLLVAGQETRNMDQRAAHASLSLLRRYLQLQRRALRFPVGLVSIHPARLRLRMVSSHLVRRYACELADYRILYYAGELEQSHCARVLGGYCRSVAAGAFDYRQLGPQEAGVAGHWLDDASVLHCCSALFPDPFLLSLLLLRAMEPGCQRAAVMGRQPGACPIRVSARGLDFSGWGALSIS